MVSLLEENLYHSDGRILDEVYVYGSSIQSRMYASGVTCSDCHDPHSGELHTGPDRNDSCAQCHLADRFATADHSKVDVGNCVTCHLPASTFMGIDDRRDHSFRIPGAGEHEMQAIRRSFDDPDPLVRIGALRALANIPAEIRGVSGSHLLRDPVRGVRVAAALAYLDVHGLLLPEGARAYGSALDEYRNSLLIAASSPDAAVRLAELESRLGNDDEAKRFYMHALRLDSQSAPAQHAFGLFLVRARDYEGALEHIRRAVEIDPSNSRYTYVYGIAANSLGQREEAIRIFRHAWLEFPDNFDIGYALATILGDSGEIDEATIVATEVKTRFPGNPVADTLLRDISTRN